MYFIDCHTPEDLKDSYRYWAKKLHPDKGGSEVDFRTMHEEYERTLTGIENIKSTLPELFDLDEQYEYYFRKVNYAGTYYGYYYKFTQDIGADILIDVDHIKLIFKTSKKI